MVHDSERRSALIKFLESCILIKNANGNILPPRDTSRCWQAACEEPLKCHNFVTLDYSTQNASITIPLQNSAVGFRSSVSQGARSPKYFGDFFCARLAWLFYMAGRAGAPSGAPVACVRSSNPVRSTTSFRSGVGGKQMHTRSPAMLKLFRAIGGMNIVPQFSFLSAFLHLHYHFLAQGGCDDIR